MRDGTFVQDHHLVDRVNDAWPVCHHHHHRPACPQGQNRGRQRIITATIKIRVWLIQHDQAWNAVNRARQTKPLNLPARQGLACHANRRGIAARKRQDHLVHAGNLRRLNNHAVLRLRVEAGNVFRNRAGQHFQRLRQITNMTPQIFGMPLLQRCPIEPDFAAFGPPGADQHLGKAGFARRRIADHAQTVAGGQSKGQLAKDFLARPALPRSGRVFGQVGDLYIAPGVWQSDVALLGRHPVQRGQNAAMRLQDAADRFPLPNHLIHWGKCAPCNDRCGNNSPRRHLLLDRKIGPECQQHGLQQHPERFGKG